MKKTQFICIKLVNLITHYKEKHVQPRWKNCENCTWMCCGETERSESDHHMAKGDGKQRVKERWK